MIQLMDKFVFFPYWPEGDWFFFFSLFKLDCFVCSVTLTELIFNRLRFVTVTFLPMNVANSPPSLRSTRKYVICKFVLNGYLLIFAYIVDGGLV